MADDGALQIYPQHSWHSEAEIIGCPAGLAALRDALTVAIDAGKGEALAFASDGEGYHIYVRRMPSWPGDDFGKAWEGHRPYYEQMVQWNIEGERDQLRAALAKLVRIKRIKDVAERTGFDLPAGIKDQTKAAWEAAFALIPE